ncbi:hypothetical protein K431DRAFT_209877, partial [Polychaeton citri CBS 116435]
DAQVFNLTVENNCDVAKTFGLYQIAQPSFQMIQKSDPVVIEPKGTSVISAPFTELGMRLSATADQGTAAQWLSQPLFEFGYSEYNGLTGTAYDLSVMEGSDATGLAAYPDCETCESKICFAEGCSKAQAWTHENQVADGSPADTVCYEGLKNFKVVWCP